MEEPTCEQLFDEEVVTRIQVSALADWRHGTTQTAIFYREEDDTFWRAVYRVSTDGETHGLRDWDAAISRVWPKQRTITVYETTPSD